MRDKNRLLRHKNSIEVQAQTVGETAANQHKDSVRINQTNLIKNINHTNNTNPNRDHTSKRNNKPPPILFINNIINNNNEPSDVKELRNKQLIQNFKITNSNNKKNSDSVRAKTVIIIINKPLINKDILNHSNIIEKINSKNFKILNNILKIIKKK